MCHFYFTQHKLNLTFWETLHKNKTISAVKLATGNAALVALICFFSVFFWFYPTSLRSDLVHPLAGRHPESRPANRLLQHPAAGGQQQLVVTHFQHFSEICSSCNDLAGSEMTVERLKIIDYTDFIGSSTETKLLHHFLSFPASAAGPDCRRGAVKGGCCGVLPGGGPLPLGDAC